MFASITLSNAADIATVAGVIGAIISLGVAYKSFKDSKNRKKIENAVSLAKYYADILIPESAFLRELLETREEGGIYYNIVDKAEIEHFSKTELQAIFKDKYDSVKKMWSEITVSDIFKAKMHCCDSSDHLMEILALVEKYQADGIGEHENTIMQEYKNYLRNLANKLEWFSMNFTQNIADEGVVYQSLHQTYFTFVKRLYFYICEANSSEVDRYYINIKKLYTLWRKAYLERSEREKKIIRQAEDIHNESKLT